jgi:acyl-coenzyme A thioesterase PaaI-like protein
MLAAQITQVPPGFPGIQDRTAHRRLLDMIIAGTAPDPPVVVKLSPPRPARWAPGELSVDAQLSDEYTWHSGIVFGGYVASLLDMFGGLVMLTVLPDTSVFLTAGLEVFFDAPTRPGPARIDAVVVELSSQRARTRVSLTQGGRVTCRALTTQAIRQVGDIPAATTGRTATTGSKQPRKDAV